MTMTYSNITNSSKKRVYLNEENRSVCVSILRNIFEFDMSQLLPRAYDLKKEKKIYSHRGLSTKV